ncbi:MAG: adenosine deaminase [Actinobacteria bacterium]|nr:adenosine deaminase [Actinomycetota bacterium]
MTVSLESYVKGLPKAELHVHIEGTLEPDLMFELAKRNSVEIPYSTVDDVAAAYSFVDLQSFLDIYYEAASVLVTEQDFYDLMAAYLRRAAADGVRRAEIFFDPQTHTGRGVGYDIFMPGFLRAIDDLEGEVGISAGLILCYLRHLSGEAACETFREASAYHHRLLGVGLDSSEVPNPPQLFADAFELARVAGLRAVAHAGEEGPPAYVTAALDHLGVERIDHGVRSEEDEVLVGRLVESEVPLTMCPLSNLALGVLDRLQDHNLKRLMDRGVKVTVNSDDPAYFGGYIADNYVAVAEALDLSRSDLAQLARHSLEATFASWEDRAGWISELDVYVAGHA